MSSNKCCAPMKWDSWNRRHLACGKPGKVERGGQWYCGIHDPERVKAKEQARAEKYQKMFALSDARRDISVIEKRIVDAVCYCIENAFELPANVQAVAEELEAAKAKVAELEAQA